MRIVLTGATGFVGKPLCSYLVGAEHEVTVLSRDAGRAKVQLGQRIDTVTWGPTAGSEWKRRVAAADAVIHLAGEPLGNRRWTPQFKQRIRASRVETTKALVEAMGDSVRRPRVLVSASAIGYYGDRGSEVLTEESPPGEDFLAHVCRLWEAEAVRAEALGVRVARMRLGIVLGPRGGALEKMLYPTRLHVSPWKMGLGGRLGSGRQWMSWVHISDVLRMLTWAASTQEVTGPVNVVSPNPVTNIQFTEALAKAIGIWEPIPVPPFALRLIAGEFADAMLASQRAAPQVAERLDYRFRVPELDPALPGLLRR